MSRLKTNVGGCSVAGCDRCAKRNGKYFSKYCSMHDYRVYINGGESITHRSGRKVGVLVVSDAEHSYRYRQLTRDGKKYRRNRWVWEQAYGSIPHGHVIHHRDGNRFNDSLDNLECLSKEDHDKLHRVLKVPGIPE